MRNDGKRCAMTKLFHKLKRTNKYNAKPTVVDGIRFDSKKEAEYYKKLRLCQKAGALIMFLRQTSFHLDAGVIYRLDFLEFWEDGRVIFTDVKGRDTAMSKLKRKMVEERYHIEITLA